MRLGTEHPDRSRRPQQHGRIERVADGDVAHASDVRQPERLQRLKDLTGDAGLVTRVLGDGGFDLWAIEATVSRSIRSAMWSDAQRSVSARERSLSRSAQLRTSRMEPSRWAAAIR